jgi:hypothetical protein
MLSCMVHAANQRVIIYYHNSSVDHSLSEPCVVCLTVYFCEAIAVCATAFNPMLKYLLEHV